MTTDPLDRLALVDPVTPVPDLLGVQRRARALRRAHRRTRLVGGTVALAAALTVGGVVLPQLGGDGTGAQPGPAAVALGLGVAPARAADVAAGCGTRHGDWVDPAGWAADPRITRAATLIDGAPWPLASAGVHETTMDCPDAVPVAVLLATGPQRGVSVWSQVADPFPAGTEGVTDVRVRGVDGRLRDFGGGLLLSWVDADGTRWIVNGSGMTPEDLVSLVDGLQLDGSRVDTGRLPAGYEPVPVPDAPASPVTRRWWVTYGDTQPVEAQDGVAKAPLGAGVELESRVATAPPELAVSYWAAETVLVDVDGHRGVFTPWGQPGVDVGGWLTWVDHGIEYRLSGALPVEQLAALARAATPVAVDDARLAGLPQTPGES